MWLCALALFFYMPAEQTMGAWATTYVTDKGMKEGAASALLSGFWLAYTISRLIAALTIPKGAETTVILVLSLVALALWVAVVLCRGRRLAAGLVIAIGVIFGPIYPTLLAVLLGHFPKALAGRAIGLLFVLGGLGCTVIPMLIGAYARRTSVQRAFLLAAASVAGLCVIALLLRLNA
jgi:fucose permease